MTLVTRRELFVARDRIKEALHIQQNDVGEALLAVMIGINPWKTTIAGEPWGMYQVSEEARSRLDTILGPHGMTWLKAWRIRKQADAAG